MIGLGRLGGRVRLEEQVWWAEWEFGCDDDEEYERHGCGPCPRRRMEIDCYLVLLFVVWSRDELTMDVKGAFGRRRTDQSGHRCQVRF